MNAVTGASARLVDIRVARSVRVAYRTIKKLARRTLDELLDVLGTYSSISSASRAWTTPFLVALTLLALGCSHETHPQEQVFQGPTMGTTYVVKVVTEGPLEQAFPLERQQEVRRVIDAKLGEVNSKMSTYLDSSELSQLNRLQALTPFSVSKETLDVFLEAQRIGAATEGAFDITVGPLVNAWGFGPLPRPDTDPSENELERLRSRVGWAKIEIDADLSTIRKLDPGVYCDLSAIAKGYAVDRVSESLSELGFADHMVEVGGEVRTRGRNRAGEPWRIGIERPQSDDRSLQRVLPLSDSAMATSGDYRNFYEKEGVRLSHAIDPRTGRPVRHRLASVTVIDPLCIRADGYATALMVLGEEKGYLVASEIGLAALLVVRSGDTFKEKATPAFAALFPGSVH